MEELISFRTAQLAIHTLTAAVDASCIGLLAGRGKIHLFLLD